MADVKQHLADAATNTIGGAVTYGTSYVATKHGLPHLADIDAAMIEHCATIFAAMATGVYYTVVSVLAIKAKRKGGKDASPQ